MKILSGMSLKEIEELVLGLNASKFRAKQIHNWIYLNNFEKNSNKLRQLRIQK